jgi:histidinol dehydrogenase
MRVWYIPTSALEQIILYRQWRQAAIQADVGFYLKTCTYQWLDDAGVKALAPVAARQSRRQSLEGHRRAAAIRLDRQKVLEEYAS